MFMSRAIAFVVICASFACESAWAQNCQLVPQTILEPRTVTAYRWVTDTEYETRQVVEYKPVWVTETRERRTVVSKPVVKNKIAEETYEVLKPIVETSSREQTVQETTYETVTEMQTQQVIVEKPVIETQYRDQHVVVRRPVTQTVMQSESVTAYRPVTSTQTFMVPTNIATQTVSQPWRASRLQWMSPGYYSDPVTGLVTTRRPGLYWTPNQPVFQNSVQSVLVPQQSTQTSLVPEIVIQQRPVLVESYQDQIETRKVAVQVQTNQRVVETRQVPVTVQKPVIRTKTESIPVVTTRYEKQEVVRRVRFVETTYEQVEEVEQYQVQVQKMVAETSTIQVRKQVLRRVEYQTTQLVPRTVTYSVPVDVYGNYISSPPAPVVVSSTPMRSVLLAESTAVAKPPVGDSASEVQGQWQTVKKPVSLSGDGMDLTNATLKKTIIFDDPTSPNVPATSGNDGAADEKLIDIPKATQPGTEADKTPALEGAPKPEEPKKDEPAKEPGLNGSSSST